MPWIMGPFLFVLSFVTDARTLQHCPTTNRTQSRFGFDMSLRLAMSFGFTMNLRLAMSFGFTMNLSLAMSLSLTMSLSLAMSLLLSMDFTPIIDLGLKEGLVGLEVFMVDLHSADNRSECEKNTKLHLLVFC